MENIGTTLLNLYFLNVSLNKPRSKSTLFSFKIILRIQNKKETKKSYVYLHNLYAGNKSFERIIRVSRYLKNFTDK